MVGAALVTDTVSSGRSMLVHQWLLAKAAAAEKHDNYSIFVFQPGSISSNAWFASR
jgi:hypothetical protein